MVEGGIRQHQSVSTSHDVANQLGRRVIEDHDVHVAPGSRLQSTGQAQAGIEAIGRPWMEMPIEQYADVNIAFAGARDPEPRCRTDTPTRRPHARSKRRPTRRPGAGPHPCGRFSPVVVIRPSTLPATTLRTPPEYTM